MHELMKGISFILLINQGYPKAISCAEIAENPVLFFFFLFFFFHFKILLFAVSVILERPPFSHETQLVSSWK